MMDDESVSVDRGELRSRTPSRGDSMGGMDYENNDDGMTTSSAEKKGSYRAILWNRKACLLGVFALLILVGMGISIATDMVSSSKKNTNMHNAIGEVSNLSFLNGYDLREMFCYLFVERVILMFVRVVGNDVSEYHWSTEYSWAQT